MTTTPESVVCIRAFGSRTRGDHDSLSDRDVLIVLREVGRPEDPDSLERAVAATLGERIDAAIYSERHLRTLFREGHLFAWHLWRESKALGGTCPTLIEEIGPPAPNTDAAQEIDDLGLLLACLQPDASAETVVYDAGILYVVLRNAATSATWFFGPDALDFSRRSPWGLEALGGPSSPLGEGDYEQLVRARKATTAGLTPPNITVAQLSRWREATSLWLVAVADFVRKIAPRVSLEPLLPQMCEKPVE